MVALVRARYSKKANITMMCKISQPEVLRSTGWMECLIFIMGPVEGHSRMRKIISPVFPWHRFLKFLSSPSRLDPFPKHRFRKMCLPVSLPTHHFSRVLKKATLGRLGKIFPPVRIKLWSILPQAPVFLKSCQVQGYQCNKLPLMNSYKMTLSIETIYSQFLLKLKIKKAAKEARKTT